MVSFPNTFHREYQCLVYRFEVKEFEEEYKVYSSINDFAEDIFSDPFYR